MHALGFVTLDKVWFVAISGEQMSQFFITETPKHGRICDLVAIQMQDGQYRTVPSRIEKLIGMPTGGQRTGFGLTVSDNAAGQQIRIIENRPIGMRDGVPQFPAFVNRPWSLRRSVAWDSPGKRELLKQFAHPLFVLLNVRIELSVSALEIGSGYDAWTAMAGSGDIDHIQVVLLDDPIEMSVDEIEPGSCTPMTQKPGFHMLNFQGFAK